jgi:hypothetical protein
VSGDAAPLLRRVSDRVGSEADPIHPLLIALACFGAAWGTVDLMIGLIIAASAIVLCLCVLYALDHLR